MTAEPSAAFLLGELLGKALVVVGPVVGGYLVARRMNADRQFDDRVRWPIAVGFCVGLLFLLSQCANAARQGNPAKPEAWVTVDEAEPAEPWPTAAEIDERVTVARYSELLTKALQDDIESMGMTVQPRDIASTGRIIYRGETPIVYVSITAGDIADVVYVIGPAGAKQAVVGCGQDGGKLDLAASGCAAKVKEVFAIDLGEARASD